MWKTPTNEEFTKIPRLYDTENIPLKDKMLHLFCPPWTSRNSASRSATTASTNRLLSDCPCDSLHSKSSQRAIRSSTLATMRCCSVNGGKGTGKLFIAFNDRFLIVLPVALLRAYLIKYGLSITIFIKCLYTYSDRLK